MKKRLAMILISLAALPVIAAAQENTPSTVVELAAGNADFSTLVAAVQAADLVDALSAEGPYTVFAPTDDAFAAALEALGLTAEELLASPDLSAILTYHVVPSALLAEDILAALEASDGELSVTTVNGADVTVTVVDGVVMLNGTASVTATDLTAGNGVVHVIDAVILPPAE